MTITIVYNDGSERQHITPQRTFYALTKAREYACCLSVRKVLLDGRRVWA